MIDTLFPIDPDVTIRRVWAMPNSATFQVPPIAKLLDRVLRDRRSVVDPFARTSRRAHHANDLDPSFGHGSAMDAADWLDKIRADGVRADAVLFDPPYSPRQISECYRSVGRAVGMKETQNATLYAAVKDRLTMLSKPGAVSVCCGWNSSGLGITRGWRMTEILLVCHGGAHNDTIVTVEVRG